MMSVEDEGEESSGTVIVGDCRTEESTRTSLRMGFLQRCHQIIEREPLIDLRKNQENNLFSYLPIMVECCWTAASSRRSKMVHSPMVMEK